MKRGAGILEKIGGAMCPDNGAEELLEAYELGYIDLTEWEQDFLESIVGIDLEDLSASQQEKLLEIASNE